MTVKQCAIVMFLLLSGISAAACADRASDASHAVILIYHHVSDATPASTSVTPKQFEQHLDYLNANDYRVWPLQRVLNAVFEGTETIPERVVSISFDDAYESVYSEARPRLTKRGWPFTVFVNTDAVDAGHSPYMNWDQLRALARAGVAIENHSAAHAHMSRPGEGESERVWRGWVRADIERAHARISAEIGREPALFAYPYGEDSPDLAGIVANDYRFALAQRSGPVGPLTDPLSIPRFPLGTGFASIERLELALKSRPIAVERTETQPRKPRDDGDIDSIHLRFIADGFSAAQLNCFAGSGEPLTIEVGGDGPYQAKIDVRGTGRPGRNKVNCTAPAGDGSGDYFWHSYQWLLQ